MKNEGIDLIEKYLTGDLTIEEEQTLSSYLVNSPEMVAEFKEAVTMKGLIYITTQESSIVVEVMDKILDADQDLENKIMSQIPQKKNYYISHFLKIAAAIFILFMLSKIGLEKVNTVASIKKSPETLITRANGQQSDSATLFVNDIINTGSVKEEISFQDGTELSLNRKSELTVVSKNPKVFKLNKGSLSAEVTPQDKPMKIETASAFIEVLGTKFNLTSEEKSSLLKVSRGKVAITDKKTGERVEVSSGEYTIAEGKMLKISKGKGPLFVSDSITKDSPKKYIDIEVDLSGETQLILIASNEDGTSLANKTAWLNPLININGRWTSLTTLTPKFIKVGHGELETFTEAKNPQQLLLNTKSYAKGFYAHANSVIIWDLPSGSSLLKCRGAILDAQSTDTDSNKFSAKFQVFTEASQEVLERYSQN
jgi:hypothetical protein